MIRFFIHLSSGIHYFCFQTSRYDTELLLLLEAYCFKSWLVQAGKPNDSVSVRCNLHDVARAPPCLTLCDPTVRGPPGSPFCGAFQATVQEWVATRYSGESAWPRDWTHISHISALAGGFFTTLPPGKPKVNFICLSLSFFDMSLNTEEQSLPKFTDAKCLKCNNI